MVDKSCKTNQWSKSRLDESLPWWRNEFTLVPLDMLIVNTEDDLLELLYARDFFVIFSLLLSDQNENVFYHWHCCDVHVSDSLNFYFKIITFRVFLWSFQGGHFFGENRYFAEQTSLLVSIFLSFRIGNIPQNRNINSFCYSWLFRSRIFTFEFDND